jgi:hypothetical protein
VNRRMAGPRFGEGPDCVVSVRCGLGSSKDARRVGGAWVEQDSNLRRQCHQIYSLAPLATWVSTRFRTFRHDADVRPVTHSGPEAAARTDRSELAVRVELTTVGLQNRCSAD